MSAAPNSLTILVALVLTAAAFPVLLVLTLAADALRARRARRARRAPVHIDMDVPVRWGGEQP